MPKKTKLFASTISAIGTAKVLFELLREYTLRLDVSVTFYIDLTLCFHLIIGRREGEGCPSPMDLEALNSPEYVDEEKLSLHKLRSRKPLGQ